MFSSVDRTYFQAHSPASSILLTGSESDSRISSSPSASEYSYGDSSNAFAMDTLNLTEGKLRIVSVCAN